MAEKAPLPFAGEDVPMRVMQRGGLHDGRAGSADSLPPPLDAPLPSASSFTTTTTALPGGAGTGAGASDDDLVPQRPTFFPTEIPVQYLVDRISAASENSALVSDDTVAERMGLSYVREE